jgi:hypothetical protein
MMPKTRGYIMKTKENLDPKSLRLEKIAAPKALPKRSLRPMRSMVAVRSFKPRTAVAEFTVRSHEENVARD